MMRSKVYIPGTTALFLSAMLCVIVPARAFSQDSPADCVRIGDDAARLACYDKAMGVNRTASLPQITGNGEAAAVAAPRAERDAAAGTSAPAPDGNEGLGLEDGRRAESEASGTFTVARAEHNDFTGWTLEFTDGQIWKQVGTDTFRVEAGRSYTITRASFNSFMLGAAGSRNKIRITRVK